jgi:hypothetical protein
MVLEEIETMMKMEHKVPPVLEVQQVHQVHKVHQV